MPMPASHGCRGLWWLNLGVAESAPCPSIAAGFCGQAAGGEFLVAGVVQRVGLVAFLCGGDLLRGGTEGGGEGRPGLPRPAGACRARRHDDRLLRRGVARGE
jgi:hypothetical protein